MEMDLSKYSIDELVELNNKVSSLISDYKDGYFYICNVRSYGRNWKDNWIRNTHTLQELCYQYDGDDGIVDVYSNNPDLSGIHNYGELKFVPSVEDHKKWKDYMSLKNSIPRHEEELDNWDKRENVPFKYQPSFAPFYTREDIDGQKLKLENFDMNFVEPKSYISNTEEDDE